MSDITVSQDQDTLVINGKPYSLSAAPQYEDQLVQQEVQSILRQLSLKDVTENLYLSVELFYVAYNGVAGAKGGTIQAEIATLQSRLALLCNECLKTMSTFQVETHSIIEQLIQTYKWLTRGNEKLAVMKLAHCSESSASMSKAAGGLAEQFKQLQVESTKARSNTIEAEASQRDKQLAAEKAEKEMVAKQKAEQANQTELVGQISDMQTLYNEAKAREEKESAKALAMSLVSAITSTIGAGLGAYAAARNPLGTLLSGGASSSSSDDAAATQAKKDADDKKKHSDDAQQKLLEMKDQQTEKQSKVNKLKNELERLNKKIADKEQDASVKEDELQALKDQREAKQDELATAHTELAGVSDKVQMLEKTAKDATAAYAAAGVALQNLAKSTGQMAAAAASAEESIHQEKMKYLNQKLELEKEKRKSLVALAEYAESIKNLKAEEGDAALSVNSLHAAVEALGKIIGTLTNASLFWDQMSAYCDRMSSKGFQQEIKDLTDPDAGLSSEERIREYRDPRFMRMFFSYLCQWVAVNGLSDEYVLAADQAQKKAVHYLQQSPTIDEAIRKAPELARNLEVIVGKSLQASRQVTVELEQQRAVIEHAEAT